MLVGSPDPTELKTFVFISTANGGVLGNIYEINRLSEIWNNIITKKQNKVNKNPNLFERLGVRGKRYSNQKLHHQATRSGK
ncbi:MAG: hypothetical protein MUO85_09890 [candidate division Zixibacteria bacterium]|nr:hypothetical protein [candidate division Zixibacteria bacterium]